MKKFLKNQVHSSYISALAFGIFVGFTILASALAVFNFGKFNNFWVFLESSSLIGTGATLFAGYWAWQAVQDQINQSKFDADIQKQDRMRAIKSTLPIALSDICEVCERNITRHFDPMDLHSAIANDAFSNFKDDTFLILQKFIEIDSSDVSRSLSRILRIYQVLLSRSMSFDSSIKIAQNTKIVGRDYEKLGDAINWAVMYSIAEKIFGYARDREDYILETTNSEDVFSAFRKCGVSYENHPDIEKVVNSRASSARLEMNL